MTTLVIAEHDHTSIKGATLNTVAAAVALGGDVHVLVAGSGAQARAKRFAAPETPLEFEVRVAEARGAAGLRAGDDVDVGLPRGLLTDHA